MDMRSMLLQLRKKNMNEVQMIGDQYDKQQKMSEYGSLRRKKTPLNQNNKEGTLGNEQEQDKSSGKRKINEVDDQSITSIRYRLAYSFIARDRINIIGCCQIRGKGQYPFKLKLRSHNVWKDK
ncbi:MAG: hypothetical protein EZS28_035337 [Streblomastix strix]|uniref:Uncharacterized protein n=1 Tax=Streblomastix strix TaxID=222440 RepID=A0A5J4UFD8_9EUKA|nr:MAG: hypothetical protein EZS28_035337 [Streblomastix strix]